MWNLNRIGLIVTVAFIGLGGCTSEGLEHGMENQPKANPMTWSDFFPDGRSARPRVAGTVARGQLKEDALLYTGKMNGKDSEIFPFPVTREVLERGRDRFDIYCAVCHGRTGYGDGIIVKRGFPHPPSYHTDDVRKMPVGHYFDVITNGFGAMYSYGDRIPAEDRWAIAAYVRALQLSQHAVLADVPEAEQGALEKTHE
jgi:hypothetical protein